MMVSVNKLCDETRYWFLARRQVSPQLLFYDYFIEAQYGCFKQHFSALLEKTDGGLSTLSSALTTVFGEAIAVPAVNIRKVLGLIIYWLGQSHNGGARDLPSKADFLDIVQSIMGDDYIFVV